MLFSSIYFPVFPYSLDIEDTIFNSFPDSIINRHLKTNAIISIYYNENPALNCHTDYYLEKMIKKNDTLYTTFLPSYSFPILNGTTPSYLLYDSLCPSYSLLFILPCNDNLNVEYQKYLAMVEFYKNDSIERIERIRKYSNGHLLMNMLKDSVDLILNSKLPCSCLSVRIDDKSNPVLDNFRTTTKCSMNGLEYYFICSYRNLKLVDIKKP